MPSAFSSVTVWLRQVMCCRPIVVYIKVSFPDALLLLRQKSVPPKRKWLAHTCKSYMSGLQHSPNVVIMLIANLCGIEMETAVTCEHSLVQLQQGVLRFSLSRIQ